MNCRTCQYELSQCLDGRLASGRRALVMDHVAACAQCGEFWRELQAAQALVLRLTRPRVDADFRERLFERIETGEGTPPAVFSEQVPLATKIRYTLTGAAAAAAVLIAATLLRDRTPAERATGSNATVASASTNDARSPAPPYQPSPYVVPLGPRTGGSTLAAMGTPDPTFGMVRPLTPDLVAVEAAREFERRYLWTRQLLDHGRSDTATVRTVCSNAADLRDLGRVLVDLLDAKCLSFGDPEVSADLHLVVKLLQDKRLRDGGDDVVRSTIAPALVESGSLSRLTETLNIAPKFDRDAQQRDLMRMTRSFPEVLDRIFYVQPSEQSAADLDPREISRTFVFRDACGPVFVMLARELGPHPR